MAYQNEKQAQKPKQYEKQCPEEQRIPEQAYFGMPNSSLMAMPVPPPGMPNSVMREMLSERQIPAAETEAERLSAGIRSGTPNSVRKEMGRRLGSDFSSVRFHTGPESVRKNEAMGARAYTKGNDVFFGRGGFDASVGAHELVHTVQQGAVHGHVSQTAAYGTVQMMPKWLERIKRHFKRSGDRSVLPRSASEPPADSAPAVPVVHGLNGGLLDNIRDNYLGTGPERSLSAPPAADSPLDHIIEDYDGSRPAPAAAAEPTVPKEPEVPSSVESEVKTGLEAVGKEGGEVDDTMTRFKKMMADADALEAQLNSLIGDAPADPGKTSAPAAAAAAAAEPVVPRAVPKSPTPSIPDHDEEEEEEFSAIPFKPSTETTTTTGSVPTLAAAAAAAEKPIVPKAGPKSLFKPSTGTTSTTGSSTVPDEEVVRRPVALLPDLTGEESDPEDEPVSRYHGQSKGTSLVNKGVSWVNFANNAVGVVKNSDDLLDYAAVGGLEWGGQDIHSVSYETNEGLAAPYIDGGTSLAGAGTAAISTVTNAMDTVRHAKNISAGESGADMVQKGMDTAASIGGVLSSGAKFLDTVGAVTPVEEFIPGVNIAAGILRTASGASQAIRGGIALHRINKEIKGLQHRAYIRKHRQIPEDDMDSAPLALDADEHEGTSSSAVVDEEASAPITASMDEESLSGNEVTAAAGPRAGNHTETQDEREKRLRQIFHHGKWISEYNRTAGSIKAGSGVLSATSGILTLTGAGTAVGAGLAAANAGLGVGSFMYDKLKKRAIRHRVIAQEMGITEDEVKNDTALSAAVSRTNAQEGTAFGGSKKEIFSQINRRRARYLLDLAGRNDAPDGSDPDVTAADNVIRALGVHRMKDGSYAQGAEELLAEKLG